MDTVDTTSSSVPTHVKGRTIVGVCVCLLLGSTAIYPQSAVSAAPDRAEWLIHDDGDCDGWSLWSGSGTNTPLEAMDFTVVDSAQLLTVRYWIEDDYNYSFILHVMDSNWDDIYAGEYTPYQIGWNDIDLSGEGIIVSGWFAVGMERIHPVPDGDGYTYPPDLCADLDGPFGHGWFTTRYPENDPTSIDYNYMIRAQVEVINGGIPTVSEWGLAAMTLLVITAGTLLFTRRRVSA